MSLDYGLLLEHTKQFDDDQLNQDYQILQFIINMFGGLKNLFLFILNDPTKFTSKQLYQLKSFILESQKAHDIITIIKMMMMIINIIY